MRKIKNIPNPNTITTDELFFIQDTQSSITKKQEIEKKDSFKGRMISMPDSFYGELNRYLKNNSTEGNRSSFIVRVVAEYIKNKKIN